MLLAQVVNPDEIVGDVVDEFERLTVRDWIVAGIVLVVTLVVARYAGRAVGKALGEGSSLSATNVTRVVRLGIVLTGVAIALWVVGVSLGPIFFFVLSIGFLLAVSFSIALADYVAGVVLIAKRPFDIGHLIQVDGHTGLVIDHDMRAITLLNVDQETVTIPNRMAIGSVITNATPNGAWRAKIPVGVAYGSDLERAKDVVEAAVTGLEGIHESPAPEVRYTGLGDSSVDFDVIVYHDASVETLEQVRHRVVIAAHDSLAEAGITIPFPQRDIWMRNEQD